MSVLPGQWPAAVFEGAEELVLFERHWVRLLEGVVAEIYSSRTRAVCAVQGKALWVMHIEGVKTGGRRVG